MTLFTFSKPLGPYSLLVNHCDLYTPWAYQEHADSNKKAYDSLRIMIVVSVRVRVRIKVGFRVRVTVGVPWRVRQLELESEWELDLESDLLFGERLGVKFRI